MSLPEPLSKPSDHSDSSFNRPPMPPPSPSRRSITLSAPSGDFGSASKGRTAGEVTELLNSIEFLPPAEGTPAALALAGIHPFLLYLIL